MKNKLVLLGAGGHCKAVIDVLLQMNKYSIEGILDLKENIAKKVLNIPVVGTDSTLNLLLKKGIRHCFITVGSTGDPKKRIVLYKLLKRMNFNFINVISPSAIISQQTKIGHGNFIAPGAIINASTIIGNNCIINTGSIVDHDCDIADNVHIAPGSTLSAGIKIGHNTHVGTGSSIIQYLTIGKNVLIGAGSVVTKNVPDNVLAYGNPCRVIKSNE